MAKDPSTETIAEPEVAAQAADSSDAHGKANPETVSDPVPADEPTVKVVLDPDYDPPRGEDEKKATEVRVGVGGLDPEADYVDDDGRVTVSKSGVEVPASVANELAVSPAVKVADE